MRCFGTSPGNRVQPSSRNLSDDRGSLHGSVLVEGAEGSVRAYMRKRHPAGSSLTRRAHGCRRAAGEGRRGCPSAAVTCGRTTGYPILALASCFRRAAGTAVRRAAA
jgi:hypothetical protein